MSLALKGLSASIRKNRPKSLNGATNLVVEVTAYDQKANLIEGIVRNGVIAGQTIKLDPGNKKVEEFEVVDDAQTSSYTPIGGMIRCEGVERQGNGTYKSRWTNAFIKRPGEEHSLTPDVVTRFVPTDRVTKKNQPIYQMQTIDPAKIADIDSMDKLRDALVAALSETGSAMIIDVTDRFGSQSLYLPSEEKDGNYVSVDAAEFVQKILDDTPQETVEHLHKAIDGGKLHVATTANLLIGPKTAVEMKTAIDKAAAKGERARLMTVNVGAYENAPLGVRLNSALARKDNNDNPEISDVYAERLTKMFLEFAPESARDAFHAGGWRAVGDQDLRAFFKSHEIELPARPARGWNKASLHLRRHKDSENFFLQKSFEDQRWASPIPNLPCTRELRRAYATEITNAVAVLLKAPELNKSGAKPVDLDENKPIAPQLAAADQQDEQIDLASSEVAGLLDELAGDDDAELDGQDETQMDPADENNILDELDQLACEEFGNQPIG